MSVFRDAASLKPAELAELFAGIDTRWFHPHDMSARGALELTMYRGHDVYLVGDGVSYGLLRGWDQGYAIPSLGVAVRSDRLREGHGRMMMVELHRIARERGSQAIRLRVHPQNAPARVLYEALGYVEQGNERGEIVMVLEL